MSERSALSDASIASPAQDDLRGVSIDVTSLCNLRCTICSLDESYAVKGTMAPETFEGILAAVPSLQHIAFSSSAEPLLHPSLASMVRRAKEASGGRIVTSFTTNGTLLDETAARDLLDAGIDALEVSMDGASRATFERIRIRARYDDVIANLRRLVRLKEARGTAAPHLSLRYTFCRDNAAELPSFVDLAASLGIDHVVVNGLEAYDATMAAKTLYGPDGNDEAEDLFSEAELRAFVYRMRIDLPALVPDRVDDCRLIDHSCIVLFDGTVVPCSPLAYERPFFHEGRGRHHPQVRFGNVRERPLLEIWRSEEYASWRRDLREGRVPDYCAPCLKRMGVICPLKHWNWLEKIGRTAERAAIQR